MITLRNDFKFALVEEYQTFWDGFQVADDAYGQLCILDKMIATHFKNRKLQAKGQKGKVEYYLFDQNTFWFVTYGKTLRSLTCIESIKRKDIELLCNQRRWNHKRKILDLQDSEYKEVEPLSS